MTMTLAQRQARFLRNLADLLDAHPHLAPVNVHSSWEDLPDHRLASNPSLQIVSRIDGPCTEADVQAWAAAVGATQIRVKIADGDGRGHLHANGHIGGRTRGVAVEVWGVVRGGYTLGDEIPVRGAL